MVRQDEFYLYSLTSLHKTCAFAVLFVTIILHLPFNLFSAIPVMLDSKLFKAFTIGANLVALSHAAALPYSNATALKQCVADMDGKLPSTLPTDFTYSGKVRKFYIAAEQVTWDYTPTGWDNWLGVPISASPRAYLAGYTVPGSLGTKWAKAIYRGYTDATFNKLSPQPPTQGINGPTLRAEVGDMIEILFVNRLPQQYASMHSMGLSYTKDNEGSIYPDSTTPVNVDQATPIGSAVPPGECYTYKWLINEGSAPTLGSPSHMWAYHSYVSLNEDLNAGLVGPTIVYAKGMMDSTMAANREFALLYMDFDESQSILSSTNAKAFGVNPAKSAMPLPSLGQGYANQSIWQPQVTNLGGAYQLTSTQAPSFHSLNGYIFANNKPFEMCQDDKVIWYVYAVGSDSHVFHMHGNGFSYLGQNMASISLNDGIMVTLPGTARGVGNWQLICHVSNHLGAGMADTYIVYEKGSCPLTKLA